MSLSDLATLRLRLVSAREDLHHQESRVPVVKALAEQAIIDALPGETTEAREKALGSNVDARSRALTLGLARDTAYASLLETVRKYRAICEDYQAQIDNLLDDRKESELAATERLNYVLAVSYGIDAPTSRAPMAVAEREALERYMAQRAVPGLLDSGPHEGDDDEDRPQAEALRSMDAIENGCIVPDWHSRRASF